MGNPISDLERQAAEAAARRGDADVLEGILAQEWGDGGSALPWIELKRQHGEPAEVAVLCRIALVFADCPDRQAIQSILEEVQGPARRFAAG